MKAKRKEWVTLTDCKSSDRRTALEKDIEAYSDTILRIAVLNTKNYHDAEDVVQEVFIRLMKNYDDFESAEHKKAWLIRVAINLCRDINRSSRFKAIEPVENYPCVYDRMANDTGTSSLRNSMSLNITIDEHTTEIELVWEYPTPAELNADDDSNYVITLFDDNRGYLEGYNVILTPVVYPYDYCTEADVKPGEHVEKGQLIGKTGSTGYAYGDQLHFEVKLDGEYLDPLAFKYENRIEAENSGYHST